MDYGAKHPQCCEIKSLSALTKCVGLLFTFGCCGVDGATFTHDMAETGSDGCCLCQQLQILLLVISFPAFAECEVILFCFLFVFSGSSYVYVITLEWHTVDPPLPPPSHYNASWYCDSEVQQ